MAQLSEWLQVMLGEIARKREELAQAQEEEARRRQEGLVRPSEPQAVRPDLSDESNRDHRPERKRA